MTHSEKKSAEVCECGPSTASYLYSQVYMRENNVAAALSRVTFMHAKSTSSKFYVCCCHRNELNGQKVRYTQQKDHLCPLIETRTLVSLQNTKKIKNMGS